MKWNYKDRNLLLKGLSLTIIAIFLLTISSARIPSPIQENKAVLKIYQRGGYGRTGFSLKINDQLICKRLKSRAWFEVEVPPGKLTLETSPEFRYPTYEGKSFSLEVEKGKVYYLESVIDYEFLISRTYLVLRDSARAMKEMRRFKLDENAKNRLE